MIQRHLSHICLGSIDLDRTEMFYRALLDARTVHEFRNKQGQRYGLMLAFGEASFLEFFQEAKDLTDGTRFRHFCIEIPDIERQHAVARKHGTPSAIRRGRTDQVLQFTLQDPDGTVIEFHQHDDRSVLKDHARFFVEGSAP